MQHLANELLSLIIIQGDIQCQLNNLLVCSLWNQLIKRTLTVIACKHDIKHVCAKGDLLSIIMGKCHRYLKEIAKWSCVGGSLVIYDWLKSNGYDLSGAWYGCWWIGKPNLLCHVLTKEQEIQARYIAIKRGLLHLVPSFLSPDYVAWLRACMTGDITTVQDHYPNLTLIGEGFGLACSEGQTEVVRWLLKNGATVSESSFLAACKSDNVKVVNALIAGLRRPAAYFAKGVIAACKEGSLHVLSLLVDLGKLDSCVCERGFSAACKHSCLEAAELMFQCGARNFRQALLESTDLDTIRWLITKAATTSRPLQQEDLKPLILKLCRHGQIQEIKGLRSYLSQGLQDYLYAAKSHEQDAIFSYLSSLV